MTSQQNTGTHPFYIGMYIHIYTHIYVHKYTSQKECLHIFPGAAICTTDSQTSRKAWKADHVSWQRGNHGNSRIDIYRSLRRLRWSRFLWSRTAKKILKPRSGAQQSPVAVATKVASQEPSPLQTHRNDRKPPKRALNPNRSNKLQVTQKAI